MFNWFKRLVHFHEWEIIEQGNIKNQTGEYFVGKYYTQKCKVCGEIRRKNVYAG